MDLTKLSDADLYALQAGDLTKVSDAGLSALSGQPVNATPAGVQPRATNFQQQRVSTQPTVAEELTGAIAEPIMKIGSAMIAKPVSEVMGIAAMFSDYLANKQGDPIGFKRHVQESLTYEPRTNLGASQYNPLNAIPELMGQAASKVTTPVMNAIRGDAASDTLRGMTANFIGEAVPQALNIAGVRSAPAIGQAVTKAGAATGEAIAARGAKAAEAASAADWDNAARIEAAQLAQKYKIKVVPSETNPTGANRLMDVAAGNKLYEKIVQENSPKWANIYKESVGLDPRTQLDANAFKELRSKLAAPYGAVSKMNFMDDGTTVSKIRAIEVPDVAANAGAAPKMTTVVDNIVNKLESGQMTGKQVLAEIKALQDSARSLSDAAKVNPNSVFTAEAKAKRAIAENLYDMILNNVKNPELYTALKDAKVKIAQSHIAEDATNLVTYRLDPTILAKGMKDGDVKLTGVLADMGKIAGNFPDVANVSPTSRSLTGTRWSRAGAGGTAGAVLGAMVGMPVEGGALGATIGGLGSYAAQKRVMSPKYQSKNAIPPDRRMFPAPPLNPAEAPYQPAAGSNQVAPYDYSQQTGYQNFTMGQPEPVAPRVTPTGADMRTPQLGYRTSKEAVLEKEAQRNAAARAAEQAQAAAESAAPRKPTSGGMLFDLDPTTGKLRAADQGVKGATPEIFQANTGANLQSASQKIAQGRAFDMTAAEKVAWGKTKVDLVDVVPELKGLSEKQIFSKMADRQWVQDTVNKIRQQEQMYADIAQRSQDRVAQSMARIQREKMTDVLEQLQESLMAPRPTNLGGQGPKTRAFKRGLLTGENQ